MSARGLNSQKPRYGELLVGRWLLGKWHLDALLGVGGTACVFRATHRNGLQVALKRLHPDMAKRPEVASRFLREGHLANKVGHPGIVKVLDDDRDDEGAAFLVMELLEGQTASAMAKERPGRRLEPREVLSIAEQVLDVLRAAHDGGVLHRDIKPENIHLRSDGRVKLLDFGIAKQRDAVECETRDSEWTQTGLVMGTPGFIAPEQAMGDWHAVDERSDLWALGASMFTLLTGRAVHDGDTINQLIFASMTRPAPAVQTVCPDIDDALARVVDRALAFRPEDRFPDAVAMLEAVHQAMRQLDAPDSVRVSVDELDPPTGEDSTLRWTQEDKRAVLESSDDHWSRPASPSFLQRRRRTAWLVAAVVVAAVTGIGALLVSGTSMAAHADAQVPRLQLAAKLAASARRASMPAARASEPPARATSTVAVEPPRFVPAARFRVPPASSASAPLESSHAR